MGVVTWLALTVGLSLPANSQVENMAQESLEITLGAGAFGASKPYLNNWTVFIRVSGYMGGHIKSRQGVCTGRTGHAEVVQVAYDATRIALSVRRYSSRPRPNILESPGR